MIRKATRSDIAVIAALHERILPDSIFVKLGRPFLTRFYYAMLAEGDAAFAYVYEHEHIPVGFIAMAASSEAFYAQIRTRAFSLSVSLMRSIMTDPRVLVSIVRASCFLFKKNSLVMCDAAGELLQIAVEPEYRTKAPDGKPTAFYVSTTTKVAEELLIHAVKELADRRVKDFKIMTGDNNIASNAFYRKMGCKKVADGVIVFGHSTSMYRGETEEILGLFHHTRI